MTFQRGKQYWMIMLVKKLFSVTLLVVELTCMLFSQSVCWCSSNSLSIRRLPHLSQICIRLCDRFMCFLQIPAVVECLGAPHTGEALKLQAILVQNSSLFPPWAVSCLSLTLFLLKTIVTASSEAQFVLLVFQTWIQVMCVHLPLHWCLQVSHHHLHLAPFIFLLLKSQIVSWFLNSLFTAPSFARKLLSWGRQSCRVSL